MPVSNNSERQEPDSTTPDYTLYTREVALEQIQDKKMTLLTMTYEEKLLKLTYYSKCQGENCSCTGFKSVDVTFSQLSFTDTCSGCEHTSEEHISHLRSKPLEELDSALRSVVDINTLHKAMKTEQRPDAKKVYKYLFYVLRKGVLIFEKPLISETLGVPPFEEACIQRGVINLVGERYLHLTGEEWYIMCDIARLFLECIDTWDLPPPCDRLHNLDAEDYDEDDIPYKKLYQRWQFYCNVPTYCNSLERHRPTLVFGRSMLRAIFKYVAITILKYYYVHREKLSQYEIKIMLRFPYFLLHLNDEIYSDDTPIFDVDYNPLTGRHDGHPEDMRME